MKIITIIKSMCGHIRIGLIIVWITKITLDHIAADWKTNSSIIIIIIIDWKNDKAKNKNVSVKMKITHEYKAIVLESVKK